MLLLELGAVPRRTLPISILRAFFHAVRLFRLACYVSLTGHGAEPLDPGARPYGKPGDMSIPRRVSTSA